MKKAILLSIGILIGSVATIALLDKSLSIHVRHEIILPQVRK